MKKLFLLLSTLIILFSCSSDEGAIETDNDFVTAEVIYTGEPEVDGCGYMLIIDEERYKPFNLPTKFKQHKLKVMLTYKIDPKGFLCGDLPYAQTTIEILDIIKK
jgi:hypothetical protein